MGFINLFIVALMPVIKVILITIVGTLLALDTINLLGQEATHHLNNLVYYVLGPAFVGSNLAETITLQSFVNLWFMPVNIFITFMIGSALAWILIRITKTPKHLHGVVIGSCSSGNTGALLLIMVPAVCKESNNPFGHSPVCSTNAESYASLSMAIGTIYMWSYVYGIMCMSAKKGIENNSTIELAPSTACHDTENCLPQDRLPPTKYRGGKMIIQHIKMIMGKLDLKKVFTPTAISVIVGFIIGIVTPFRKLLIGDSAPLRVIDTSTYLLGEAAVPCMTLILGANLLKGLNGSEVRPFVTIGIIAVRNIVMPILGVFIVKAAHRMGMVPSDSLYQFILMLQYAVPPATAVGTISEFLKLGQGECSVIMLWTYAVASISLTLWSTLFMWLLS